MLARPTYPTPILSQIVHVQVISYYLIMYNTTNLISIQFQIQPHSHLNQHHISYQSPPQNHQQIPQNPNLFLIHHSIFHHIDIQRDTPNVFARIKSSNRTSINPSISFLIQTQPFHSQIHQNQFQSNHNPSNPTIPSSKINRVILNLTGNSSNQYHHQYH